MHRDRARLYRSHAVPFDLVGGIRSAEQSASIAGFAQPGLECSDREPQACGPLSQLTTDSGCCAESALAQDLTNSSFNSSLNTFLKIFPTLLLGNSCLK